MENLWNYGISYLSVETSNLHVKDMKLLVWNIFFLSAHFVFVFISLVRVFYLNLGYKNILTVLASQ